MIIAAHGNSLRALIKYLDSMSDDAIVGLNIPTGQPLVYEFADDLKPIRTTILATRTRSWRRSSPSPTREGRALAQPTKLGLRRAKQSALGHAITSRALVPRGYSTAMVTSVIQVMSTLSPTLT